MGYSHGIIIILAIPVVLSIVTGFAMVILVPFWFFRRNSLTAFRKTVVPFALAGLLVPLVVIACIVTKHAEMVSASVLWVWPGIVASATVPRSATSAARGLMFGIGMLSNVGLYSWLGLVVGSIWKAAKR
jgi:hypothetical protein